jgi:8-oxo-dGTP diphosphatase
MTTDNNPAATRLYPDRPFVGVGVVVWRGDEFLLIQRGKEPRRGEWSLPGGMQETGETVFEAGAREILEETNLQISNLALVDVVDSVNRDADGRVRTHYTLVDLVGAWADGEAVAGSDADGVGWFRLGDLTDLGLWSETNRIIRKSDEIRQG